MDGKLDNLSNLEFEFISLFNNLKISTNDDRTIDQYIEEVKFDDIGLIPLIKVQYYKPQNAIYIINPIKTEHNKHYTKFELEKIFEKTLKEKLGIKDICCYIA